jgi:hypothetical protein
LEEEDEFSTAVAGEDIGTVVGRDEEVDDAAAARPSSQASVQSSQSVESQRAATVVWTNSTTSGRQSSSSAPSSTGHRPPTHMTPLSLPPTRQRGNSPDSPDDRIGSIMAMMMMNQASDRDER